MSLNNKHCLLFLVIFGILLFGVSIASATEVQDVNHTQEMMDDIKLSTPDNYDVDKVVQSSTSQSSTDAEVKNYNKSDKTINSENTEIANIKTSLKEYLEQKEKDHKIIKEYRDKKQMVNNNQ